MVNKPNGSDRVINNPSQSKHVLQVPGREGCHLNGCWAQISNFCKTEIELLTASLIWLSITGQSFGQQNVVGHCWLMRKKKKQLPCNQTGPLTQTWPSSKYVSRLDHRRKNTVLIQQCSHTCYATDRNASLKNTKTRSALISTFKGAFHVSLKRTLDQKCTCTKTPQTTSPPFESTSWDRGIFSNLIFVILCFCISSEHREGEKTILLLWSQVTATDLTEI